jgi:hypothetical protein
MMTLKIIVNKLIVSHNNSNNKIFIKINPENYIPNKILIKIKILKTKILNKNYN